MYSGLLGNNPLADWAVWISDILNMIWLTSFWNNNWHLPGFPRLSQLEPSQRVLFRPPVWDVKWVLQSGVPSPSASTHTLSFSLKHSHLPRLTARVFIYFRTTSLLFFIHLFVFVLSSAVWSFDVWVSDAQLTCLSYWFIFSLSPWYFSLSFPLFWGFFFVLFLLFQGDMFLQACWGFFVWSAVFQRLSIVWRHK